MMLPPVVKFQSGATVAASSAKNVFFGPLPEYTTPPETAGLE